MPSVRILDEVNQHTVTHALIASFITLLHFLIFTLSFDDDLLSILYINAFTKVSIVYFDAVEVINATIMLFIDNYIIYA